MSLSRIYNLIESVPSGASAMVGDWSEAERHWPGCSAAWDVAAGEEWLEGRDIELFQFGPLLFAGSTGSDEHRLYVNGEWADLGSVKIEPGGGAWVKLVGKYRGWRSPNGHAIYAPMTVFVPRVKRISVIDVVGPDPEEMVGFSKPSKPRGSVTAEKRGEITAEDVRQAVLAIMQGGANPQAVIDIENRR